MMMEEISHSNLCELKLDVYALQTMFVLLKSNYLNCLQRKLSN